MLTPLHHRSPPWLRSFGRARHSYGAVLVHPDGQRLIAADHDGTATVWSLADGRELLRLPALLSAWELEDARRVELLLHPDGVRLFVTVVIVDTSDVTLCWNLDRGDLIESYTYPRVPWAFVGDRGAVTAHGLWLTLWDLETGETIRDLYRSDASWNLFGMIGEYALTGGRDVVELWHLRDAAMRWSATSAEARGAAIAGDAAVLASPGRVVLRAAEGEVIRRLACPALGDGEGDWIVRVDRAATTAVIAGATDDLVAIDLATGALRSRFPRPDKYVDVAIAAGDRDALVWSDVAQVAAVWSLATGACRLRAPSELVLAPDGETAITNDGARLHLWPVDGRDLADAAPPWTAISAGTDGVVALDRASCVHVVEPSGAPRRTWSLAATIGRFVLAGDRLAFAEDGAIAVLDARTGARVKTLEMASASSIAMSPDGHIVAAVTTTGEVQVWRIADEGALASFRTRDRSPEILAIEPDARRLAIRAGTAIELWRAHPPLRLHTFRSRTQPSCAAFDPSRRWLVSGHHDGALVVRDTIARAHHATLDTQAGPVRTVAIRGALVACGSGGEVSVWDLVAGARLGAWSDDDVLDLAWLDDDTLACATEGGLVLLRLSIAAAR
jgi:WD40 repeat protein